MITGVIDIPNTEDVPDGHFDSNTSVPYNISSLFLNASDNRDSGYAAETTSYNNSLWLSASPPTTINPLLSDGDVADTVSSQTQTFWLSEEGTLTETAADDHNANTWEQQSSFATEYPYYDYQDTGQSLYPDPVLSLAQENSNLMLSPSYNFSGLQVTPISITPKAWDSQDEFLQEVGLKLYMFVPAIVAGTLLSISFWILAMIIIRTYGYLRKKLFPSLCTPDLEMNPSGKQKEAEAELSNVQEKIFKSDMDTILSSDREFRPTKHHKKGFDEKRFTSEGSNSFHSSPVSLSSGIGASEDRDTGDTDSRASGETEPGDSEPRPQHHRGNRHR